jgi:hypothetical protein
MEAACFSEMFLSSCRTTWRNIIQMLTIQKPGNLYLLRVTRLISSFCPQASPTLQSPDSAELEPLHKDSASRRFDPQQTGNHNWVKSRSQESYARNYYIVFPNDERLAGRNFLKGPFHQVCLSFGNVFLICFSFSLKAS